MESNDTKKAKWIVLPLLIAKVIMVLSSIFVMQIVAVKTLGVFKGGNFNDYMNAFNKDLMKDSSNLLISVIYASVTAITMLAIFKAIFADDKEAMLFKRAITKPAHMILGLVLFVVSVQYVCAFVMDVIATAFPEWLEAYNALIESMGAGPDMTIGWFFYSIILAPACEEFVFRGVTLSAARKLFPAWLAILIQAVFFGYFHGNAMQGAYTAVFGIALGYIMYLYDNILLAILAHALFNLLGQYGGTFLLDHTSTIASVFFLILGTLIVCYVSVLLLKSGAKPVKNDDVNADI
ncbi:MAG: CPBP family intramembrane metalloprotease [Pseudobutyrivibrio sp.]|nr:CPBP family intramembrane metalloprotease [Pseudobutyrivibrio sp.]